MGLSRYFRRARWDAERAQELQDYLAREVDDNLGRGMSPEEATRAAHRKLGNATRIREDIYEMNTFSFLENLWQDLRFGVRLLRKNPTFAAVAILTLALGTGANAAIFQLVNAVRLRTLPVERPQELVSIGIDMRGKGRVGRGYGGRSFHTEPLYRALEVNQHAFSSLFAWGSSQWDLSSEGERRPADGLYVSGNFFPALGVHAQLGRLIGQSDDQKGCGTPAAVLSHRFWQTRYGGHPGVVGQAILLDRQPFAIVGVTPPQFFGVEVGRTFDVAVPLCAEPIIRGAGAGTGRENVWWLDVMARLRPEWTIERAQAHLAALSPSIFASTVWRGYNADMVRDYVAFTFTAERAATGVSNLRGDYATELWVLLGLTALVLLITCANLANLMLARATARDREFAVRLAIGASRGRVIRQMLAESLLIAALGAVGGLILARWLSEWLVLFLSTESNRLFVDLVPDWRVFLFIALIATLACIVFGLSPALKATGANPGRAMQAGGRSGTEARDAFAARRALMIAQVALSTVLVVGALLFGRSLQNLAAVDTGFESEGLLATRIDLRRTAIQPEGFRQAYDEIVRRVRALPGVRHAAEADIVPMSGSEWTQRIVVNGRLSDGLINFNMVGGEYFAAMGTPLLAGRTFDLSQDRLSAPKSVVINETFARRFFPQRSPLGETFQMESTPGNPSPVFNIVGLVRDTKYLDLREEFTPIAYLALSQEERLQPFLGIVVRSETSPASLTPALTRAITDAAPGAAVSYDQLSEYVRESLLTERLMASLSGFFGGLALLIATIGLYGVVSYMVTRRRAEIGVRMALGADPRQVVAMVLAESGGLLGAGVAIGIALAILAARVTASLLYGLQPWDITSFAVAVTALGLVTLLAAWIPARRASRVSPTSALRE